MSRTDLVPARSGAARRSEQPPPPSLLAEGDRIVRAVIGELHRRRDPSRVGSGSWLIALPSSMRAVLGVPNHVRVLDVAAVLTHTYDLAGLAVDGIVGVYFSDRMSGGEVGLVDLDQEPPRSVRGRWPW